MRFIFVPNPRGPQVDAAGRRGYLQTLSDAAKVAGPLPILTSREGIVDYMPAVRRAVPPLDVKKAKLWLIQAGIELAVVDAQIAAIPDAKARAEAEIEWEYGPLYRDNPLVISILAVLGLSPEQGDAAFLQAGT